MTSNIIPTTTQNNNCYILYDESVIKTPGTELFNPDWLKSHGDVMPIGTGRGSAWYVNFDDQQWVLRHYRRGGFISRVVTDTYWNLRLNSCRSWHEFNLLKTLYSQGLPVPRPVAACIRRNFGFYQADIIIQKIPNTLTLAETLEQRKLTAGEWQNIATTIRNFHDYGVYHADLNANNILIDGNNKIYIIDFDRGKIKKHGPWKEANLERLKRSLNKIRNNTKQFLYQNSDWEILQSSYSKKQSL